MPTGHHSISTQGINIGKINKDNRSLQGQLKPAQPGCGSGLALLATLSTFAGCGMTLAPILSASCGARGARGPSLQLLLAGSSSRSSTACGAGLAASAVINYQSSVHIEHAEVLDNKKRWS